MLLNVLTQIVFALDSDCFDDLAVCVRARMCVFISRGTRARLSVACLWGVYNASKISDFNVNAEFLKEVRV